MCVFVSLTVISCGETLKTSTVLLLVVVGGVDVEGCLSPILLIGTELQRCVQKRMFF